MFKIQMIETTSPPLMDRFGSRASVLYFEFWSFEFVSDFEFWI